VLISPPWVLADGEGDHAEVATTNDSTHWHRADTVDRRAA
jgi:hypothetical protein